MILTFRAHEEHQENEKNWTVSRQNIHHFRRNGIPNLDPKMPGKLGLIIYSWHNKTRLKINDIMPQETQGLKIDDQVCLSLVDCGIKVKMAPVDLVMAERTCIQVVSKRLASLSDPRQKIWIEAWGGMSTLSLPCILFPVRHRKDISAVVADMEWGSLEFDFNFSL